MRERGTTERGGSLSVRTAPSKPIKLLPPLSRNPCDHCLCIEDGIGSRRKGLILVTLRCCRCDQVCA
jgi:hypothetical protein